MSHLLLYTLFPFRYVTFGSLRPQDVLQDIETLEHDPVTKVELLSEAVRAWNWSGALKSTEGIIKNNLKLNLENLNSLLLQAKQQPHFNKHILRKWADTLEGAIRHTEVLKKEIENDGEEAMKPVMEGSLELVVAFGENFCSRIMTPQTGHSAFKFHCGFEYKFKLDGIFNKFLSATDGPQQSIQLKPYQCFIFAITLPKTGKSTKIYFAATRTFITTPIMTT
ncbi:hypothetical protein M422DRAFT_266698 [Sphaerobolus stellatus SS14]|uniref:Uncharacterized protein n=1 Tax=Sphaerobolus stellatus (strain SS14) TaxID=990650 RepID=A0A0C9TNG9_SPHS4|nr:hypothetical protein M422DRAFT_266698 [Sphaerobolus stellatus SS14]